MPTDSHWRSVKANGVFLEYELEQESKSCSNYIQQLANGLYTCLYLTQVVTVNRTDWEVSRIDVTPVCWADRVTGAMLPSRDLFQIRVHSPSNCALAYSEIAHIPEELQPYFIQNAIKRFSVEILPIGRLASRLLPGAPAALVCAITTQSDQQISAIPKTLRRARRGLQLMALALGITSSSLLATGGSPVFAVLCIAGSVLALRAVSDIPSA